MMGVELFDASDFHVQLFNSAMRELNWSQLENHSRMFWTYMNLSSNGDAETLLICKTQLAIAASSASLVDFEGTVILDLPEEHWNSLNAAGLNDGDNGAQ